MLFISKQYIIFNAIRQQQICHYKSLFSNNVDQKRTNADSSNKDYGEVVNYNINMKLLIVNSIKSVSQFKMSITPLLIFYLTRTELISSSYHDLDHRH